MGGHAGFALDLALARPEKKVILFDSESDILMSLGILVTIAEQQPANFYHFLIDNEYVTVRIRYGDSAFYFDVTVRRYGRYGNSEFYSFPYQLSALSP